MWVLLALALSTQVERAASDPSLPEGARVLFTVDGKDYDHLGKGLLDLGDIDGDHVPDFLVGAICGVPGLTQARGYALACSGKDGHVLRRFEGREGAESEAFACRPMTIGDLDGDGVSEVAIDGEPGDLGADYGGYAMVFSPKTGKRLRTFGGTTSSGSEPGWVDGAMGVGDLDGNGAVDLVVWGSGDHSWVYLNGGERPNFPARGTPIGSTPDLDGDGVRDLLFTRSEELDKSGTNTASGRLYSAGKGGKLLGAWASPASPAGPPFRLACAGDIDRDGVPDVLAVFYTRALTSWSIPAEERAFDCVLVSGKDGKKIHSWREEMDGVGQIMEATGLSDLDGDGVPEFVISRSIESSPPRSRVRIYSGKTRTLLAELTSPGWSFGICVRSIGDLDGDKVPELLVGEHEFGNCAGRAWVISLGKPVPSAPR